MEARECETVISDESIFRSRVKMYIIIIEQQCACTQMQRRTQCVAALKISLLLFKTQDVRYPKSRQLLSMPFQPLLTLAVAAHVETESEV